jgi:hypothetical protein
MSNIEERQSASLMYFDVESKILEDLNHLEQNGDEWKKFTKLCLADNEEDAYQGERSNVDFARSIGVEPTRIGF